jgi:hypothetical protein
MTRSLILFLALIAPAAGIANAAVVVPAGKLLSVRLSSPVSSLSSASGEKVWGVLVAPVYDQGQLVLASGAQINGRISGPSLVG